MSRRIQGRDLALFIGGELRTADATSVVLDKEEADDDGTTFEAMDGDDAYQWFMELNAISSYAAGSLWSALWDHVGDELPYRLAPYGNPEATPEQPHFVGRVVVVSRPPIGGEAGTTWSYEIRVDCTATPYRLEGPVPYPSELLYPSEILYPQGVTA